MNQNKSTTRIQVEFLCTELDQHNNLRLTRIDTKSKKRVPVKCIVEYDFAVTLSKNITAMLKKIEFKGNTEYILCMERTLQNKPWEMPKKDLLVNMHMFKEEYLKDLVIERELYYLIPKSCMDDIRQQESESASKSRSKSAKKQSKSKKKAEIPVLGDKVINWHKKRQSSDSAEDKSEDESKDAKEAVKPAEKGRDLSSFESDSASKDEERKSESYDESARHPRKCKTKSKEKPKEKEPKKEKDPKKEKEVKKVQSGRTSSKSRGLFANAQIAEFINDPSIKSTVYENESSLQKQIIDKMNGIAKESKELKNESYELRFQRDKDPKYVQLRCVMKKCRFSVWFNFKGSAADPTKLQHARNINLSHQLEEHNNDSSASPSERASSKSNTSDKPTEEKPTEEKQTEEKQSEEKQSEEKQSEEKQSDEKMQTE